MMGCRRKKEFQAAPTATLEDGFPVEMYGKTTVRQRRRLHEEIQVRHRRKCTEATGFSKWMVKNTVR